VDAWKRARVRTWLGVEDKSVQMARLLFGPRALSYPKHNHVKVLLGAPTASAVPRCHYSAVLSRSHCCSSSSSSRIKGLALQLASNNAIALRAASRSLQRPIARCCLLSCSLVLNISEMLTLVAAAMVPSRHCSDACCRRVSRLSERHLAPLVRLATETTRYVDNILFVLSSHSDCRI